MEVHNRMISDLSDDSLYESALKKGMKFIQSIHDREVYPSDQALKGLESFVEEMPTTGTTASSIIDYMQLYGSPATNAGLGGRYFGFVHGSVVPVGFAAKTLATFWDQCATMHVLSPVAAKLESVVESWLKSLFNLPQQTVAGFVSGTSAANLCGIAAARYRLLKRQGWDVNDKGLFNAPRIRIVMGRNAHSTILKAISIIGFGKDNIEWVDVDDQGRIKENEIPDLDDRTLLLLQAGDVNSGSFDNFESICTRANQAGAWIHIDGAFGLWASGVTQLSHLTKGIELATSWATDGHKTLNTPYDAGVILSADPEALAKALDMKGAYIILSDQERDGMRFTPEMSKRARIFEMWAIMKYLGRTGIDEMVFTMHVRAVQFAKEISEVEGFEVLNDVVFNQVLIGCESDKITNDTVLEIQKLRTCWVGGSAWMGRRVIRVSVCSWMTTEEDISISVDSFKKALGIVKNNQN